MPRFPRLLLALVLVCLAAPALHAQSEPDPIHHYNEACRLAVSGDTEAALASLARAFELGFDDLQFADDDPDLDSLRRQPAFLNLMATRRAALQLDSAARGAILAGNTWSRPIPLDAGPGPSPSPTIRLRWQPLGLDFELTGTGPWSALGPGAVTAPWNGGPGLVLTLAVPDGPFPFASATTFITAFGRAKNTPVGGVYHPATGWQRVLELDPEIQVDSQGQSLTLRGTIPWRTIQPFHPLVDTRLGFNAALRVQTEDGQQMLRAEAFADPAAFRTDRSRRRFIPLDFDTGTATREDLVGALNTARNTGDTVELTLAMVSPDAGAAVLTVDFTDNQGRSVVPGGARSLPLDLKAGDNRRQQEMDVSSLKPGLYRVRTSLRFPSGRTAVWESHILQLGSAWQDRTEARVAALAPWARPTGHLYLETIAHALDRDNPRLDPGPLATTLNRLEGMLTSAEATGSILPDSGLLGVAYTGPDGAPRTAGLYLPPGWRERGPVQPVIVLGENRVLTGRLVSRVSGAYLNEGLLKEGDRQSAHSPVYLVPLLPETTGSGQEKAVVEARAANQWALAAFATDGVALAGVDMYGAAALKAMREEPATCRALLIMAGAGLAPWPQATDEFVDRQMQPAVAGVSITWLDFPQETRHNPQAKQLLESLRRVGYDVARNETIKGGLNHTQIADRVVLWAESLP